jgi:hypothetical protein
MADAGSSGTKLFVGPKGGNMTNTKVESACESHFCDNNGCYDKKCEYQGLAALACPTVNSTCTISADKVNLQANLTVEQLRTELPKQLRANLRDMRASLNCTDSEAYVPLMATAGMRLLTDDESKAIWDNVCGRPTGETVGFYPQESRVIDAALGETPMCGTISGTTEAYFEYIADWKQLGSNQSDDVCRVSLTMGGASSQIAVRVTSAQLDGLKGIESVMENFTKAKNSDKFYRFLNSEKYGKIILVSFLGTGKDIVSDDDEFITSRFAGGINTMQARADELGPDGKKNYTAAVKMLEAWINGDEETPGDKWWQAVSTKLMPIFANKAESVVFNTAALHDNKTLTDDEWKQLSQECKQSPKDKDAVKNIVLDCVCAKNGAATFGYKGENTCYKTWWTDKYKNTMGKPCLQQDGKMKTDLADWANGVIHLLQTRDEANSGSL